MQITLYNSKAEKKILNKNEYLHNIIKMTGTLREACSVSLPSVVVELDPNILQQNILNKTFIVDDSKKYVTKDGTIKLIYDLIAEILTCNYAYIKEFNRYYFVTDIISLNRNLWRINLRCDVLMSFYGGIKNLNALISRNEFTFNNYIVDDLVNYKFNKEIIYSNITNLSTVKTLTTTPSTSGSNCVIAYLTDDTIRYSSSTPSLDDLPTISLYASATNISTQYMTGVTGILYNLAKAVYKDDTLLSFIKNITVYPYSIDSYTDSSVTNIKIGESSYTLTDTFKYPEHILDRVVIAHFLVPNAVSFLDYSPFTLYEIFIPYYGFVSLSGEAILGKVLKVFYLVNYEDGTATAYIYNVTDKKVLFSGQCVIGVKVSLSSSNALEIANQKTALALNTGINLIGSALSVAGGIATENPITTASGVLKATSTIGNAITTYNQLYDLGTVGVSSGSDGLSNIQKVFIKKTRSIPINYNNEFLSLYGKPLNEYRKLSELTGFTQIKEVHIEGFDNANDSEINEIDALLKSGIIL